MTLVKISLSLIQPVILQSDSRLDCCQTMIISLNAEPRSVVEHSQLDKFLTEQVWINVPVPLCNLLASIPVNHFGCRVVTIFQPFRNVSTYCITALLFIGSFPKLHIAVSVKHKFHRSLGFVSPLKITSDTRAHSLGHINQNVTVEEWSARHQKRLGIVGRILLTEIFHISVTLVLYRPPTPVKLFKSKVVLLLQQLFFIVHRGNKRLLLFL